MSLAHHHYHHVNNHAGWHIELKQCRKPKSVHSNRNPVLIVPGYGMNSFIFGFHPRGLSFEEYLTQMGFEVWSVNLRGQRGTYNVGGSEKISLKDWGTVDLRAAIDFIVKESQSRTGKVDLIGGSLGGTLIFMYASLVPHNKAGSLVAIGAPLRWEAIHPLVKMLAFSPRLIELIPFSSTRELLRLTFPFLLHLPIMKVYLHKEMIDLRHKEFLLETVENPNRFVNREIAQWINNKDLIIDGKNLSHAFSKVTNPLLCVVANSDGIVPPLTCLSAHEQSGAAIKETLVVGTDKLRFAHADLFISNECHERVFKPIGEWLLKVEGGPIPRKKSHKS